MKSIHPVEWLVFWRRRFAIFMFQAVSVLFVVGLAAPFPPFERHAPTDLHVLFPIQGAQALIHEFFRGERALPGVCRENTADASVGDQCRTFAYHKFMRALLLLQVFLVPLLLLIAARRRVRQLHGQLSFQEKEGGVWVGTVSTRVFLRPDAFAWSNALWQVEVVDAEGKSHRVDLPQSAPRPLPGRRFWVARYRWSGRLREMGGLYAPHMALLSSVDA